MATTTATVAGVQMIALSEIRHDQNVRQELVAEEVDALAQSIALLGQLVPVSVRPDTENGRYVLIAGHKRYAALAQLGHTEIRAEVRPDGESETAERAAENVVRSSLNPYEEAIAVKAMLERGLSEDGAAQALGWPKQRVTARVKLLELPEQAQQLTGQGVIPLSAVEQLRSIGQVSPELLDAVIGYLGDGNEWAAERLAREPGWVIDSALRSSSSKVFAAHLAQLDSYEIADLRLGKKTEALLEEAATLHKQLDRYAYGAPSVRFTESDVDQARAAGVLVEFENARPIIVDRSLYRELSKQAIKRTVEELRARVAEVAQQRKAAKASGTAGRSGGRGAAGARPRAARDRRAGARREPRSRLGTDERPGDGRPGRHGRGEVLHIRPVGRGLRPEPVHADRRPRRRARRSRGPARDRGVPHRCDQDAQGRQPGCAADRLRRPAQAGEADRVAVEVHRRRQDRGRAVRPRTRGDRRGAVRQPAGRAREASSIRRCVGRSHKDHARKALAKLAGPHLPATLKQVEKAVAKAHSENQQATGRRAEAGLDEEQAAELADADAVVDELDVDDRQDVNRDDQVPDVESDVGGVAM